MPNYVEDFLRKRFSIVGAVVRAIFLRDEFAIVVFEREADLNPCLLHVINALSCQEGR
jgi:hypothetical protein